MPNPKKIQIVNSLVEELNQSPNFVLIHFENIPHQKLEQLRKMLRPLTSSFRVVKNTLLKVAALKLNKKEITDDRVLTGASALLILPNDWTAALSTFWKFAQTDGKLSFKMGIIDGKICEKDDLVTLAQLPPKDELISKILSAVKSPPTRLVYTMRFGMMRIIRAVKKIENSF